jgi:putative ABC transport system ATP-binding protein
MTPDPPAALDIRRLKFRYERAEDPDGWVVDVPELVVASGAQLLVTGPSGSGKSTLLHLVAGLVRPAEGSILVHGRDVVAMPPAARDEFRGRAIGMIFQTFNLLHGFTALENVMMAMVVSDIPRREHRDRARRLLDELGIARVDEDPDRLSVGQRQRVAVARAIACEPVLVLADEPTASLDPDAAAVAMDLVQAACTRHGAALVCTSHDPAMQGRFEHRTSLGTLARTTAAPAG